MFRRGATLPSLATRRSVGCLPAVGETRCRRWQHRSSRSPLPIVRPRSLINLVFHSQYLLNVRSLVPQDSTQLMVAFINCDSPFAGCQPPTMLSRPSSTYSHMLDHEQSHRPEPKPLQKIVNTTSSENLHTGSFESNPSTPIDLLLQLKGMRCSRCRETNNLYTNNGHPAMLNYGLNLWYCVRCASFVGWPPQEISRRS